MTQRIRRTFACCLTLLLAIALPAAAQNVPEVNYPIHQDISPPVRGLVGHVIVNLENKAPMRVPAKAINPQFDPVLQNSAGPAPGAPAGTSFEGVPVGAPGCNCAPPDTQMAVGPTQIVQWVNTDWAIFDKTGAMQAGYPKAGNSFWQGFGGDCETHNNGDPITQYDKLADRWIATQFALNTPFGQNYQCIAVSVTNDPGGSYFRYQYAEPFMPDYPKASVWPVAYTGAPQGAYFFSYNMFQFGQFFQGPRACAYDRSKMLTGAAAPEVCFQLGSSFGSILSSDLDGSTPALPGTPNFYFDFDTNALLMWKFTPNFATPSSSTFTGPTNIPVAAFSAACGGGTCVPQVDTTQQLDTLADRLMYRNSYRNFGDHEAVLINHSVTASASVGVRWYEIRDPNGTPTVFQQGTFAPDSSYRWMGSIASDQAGDIAVGYSLSSSSMHPAIAYSGRQPGDALGTLQAEATLFQGAGSETTGLSRWGDYSAMRIDPSDDCTFWYTTEYIPSNGTFNWRTRIGSFKFDSCGIPPTPPLPPSGLSATPINAHRIDLAWTDNSNNESGFNVYRCTGDATACAAGPFGKIGNTGANATAYSDTSAQPSTTYTYHVTAFNSSFESAASNDATATTVASNPPNGDPSGLTATAVSSSQINLAWTSGSTNQDGFAIERCTGTGCTNFAEIARTAASATSYANTGLASNTTYNYRVRAFNGDGYSNYSNTAGATTFDVPPAPPSGLTATQGRNGNSAFVDLRWTDNSNNETNFVVERCTGAGCSNFGPIATPTANTTTYHDTAVARRTTYVYRVKAQNAQGDSAYSSSATTTTK